MFSLKDDNHMAKATEVALNQLIFDYIMQNGPIGGAKLVAAFPKVDQKEIIAEVDGLKKAGYVLQDGRTFAVNPEVLEQGAEEAQTEEDDPFAEEAPAAVAPKAKAAVAQKPTVTKAAAPPAKAAPVAQKAAVAAKPKAKAPVDDEEDDGSFKMTFKAMDKLDAEELSERIEAGIATAQALFESKDYTQQLAAELIMRWLPRGRRRLEAATK
jgi:hypothetical protein